MDNKACSFQSLGKEVKPEPAGCKQQEGGGAAARRLGSCQAQGDEHPSVTAYAPNARTASELLLPSFRSMLSWDLVLTCLQTVPLAS